VFADERGDVFRRELVVEISESERFRLRTIVAAFGAKDFVSIN